jgi:Ca2+/Na+ antiporter
MHGEWWLENPALSIILFCIAFYLLYRALRTKKHYRYHQHSDHNDVQRVIFGRKVIDTSTGWLLFTGFLALCAVGAHFLAEYTFHLYDITPIDKFTHGLSGMAITESLFDEKEKAILFCCNRSIMDSICSVGNI